MMAAKVSGLTCVGVLAARSVKATGIGRLLVTILEATELKAAKPNGECGPTRRMGFLFSLATEMTH